MEADVPTIGAETGESAPAQETTASPAVDRSTLSDNELLGIGSYEKEEPAEAAPAAEAKPVTDTEAAPVEVVDETKPIQGLASEELKRLLEKEPAVRQFYFRERAFSELFPTIGEAREMRSMFPTTEDARAIVGQAEALLAAERTYAERPKDFIQGIAKGDPAAFERFVDALPIALYEYNQELYRSKIAEPAITSAFVNLADAAKRVGDEELLQAIGVIKQRLDVRDDAPAASVDPRVAELEAFKRQVEAEKAAESTQRIEGFRSSVTQTFGQMLQGRVSEAIDRLNPTMSDGAKARVRQEIIDDVVERLTQNKWLSQRAYHQTNNGDFGPQHLQSVVELLAKHAEHLIPVSVSAVMSEWTNEIIKANAVERSEAKRVAGQKEVGGGNQAPRDDNGRFKSVKRGPDFYQKWSDKDIIEGRHREA